MIAYYSIMNSMNAAFLFHKLQDLDENNAEAVENARLYEKLFADSAVETPRFNDEGTYVYNRYVVRVQGRDELAEVLKEKNIGHQVPCPVAVHLQPSFAYLGIPEGSFPMSEEISARGIALPVGVGLKKRQIEEVADVVLEFCKARATE